MTIIYIRPQGSDPGGWSLGPMPVALGTSYAFTTPDRARACVFNLFTEEGRREVQRVLDACRLAERGWHSEYADPDESVEK